MGNQLPASLGMSVLIDFSRADSSLPISLGRTYLPWMPDPPAARTNGASRTALTPLKMNFYIKRTKNTSLCAISLRRKMHFPSSTKFYIHHPPRKASSYGVNILKVFAYVI